MVLLTLVALMAFPTTHAIYDGWGANCSYTAEAQSGTVSVLKNEEQFVSIIPAGKEKIFVDLSATADLDTKLVAADGTILLMYDLGGADSCECVDLLNTLNARVSHFILLTHS
jgi:hypothetical protein